MNVRIKPLAAVLLLAAFGTALAADEGVGFIKVTDKAALEAAKDTNVTIEGKVSEAAWSKSGKVMNVEFEDAPDVIGAAFEKGREKLDAAFNGDLAKTLTGADRPHQRQAGGVRRQGAQVQRHAADHHQPRQPGDDRHPRHPADDDAGHGPDDAGDGLAVRPGPGGSNKPPDRKGRRGASRGCLGGRGG